MAAFGIAVGCAALVALLNIGHSAAQHTRQMFQRLGSSLVLVSIDTPGVAAPPVRLSLAALPPAIVAAAPVAVSVAAARLGEVREALMVAGSTPALAQVLDLQIHSGRALSRHDDGALHVLLGAALAERWQAKPGDRLQLDNYLFDVIGILAQRGANPMLPIDLDQTVLMPLSALGRLASAGEVSAVLARGDDRGELAAIAQQLLDDLQAQLPALALSVQLPAQLLASMASQTQLLRWSLAGTAAIALLLGGVGIMNVMVMNVSQRRREIGVRLALGARGRDIAGLFLLEAVVLAAAAAFAGLLLGLAAAWGFVWLTGWGFAFDVRSLPAGVGSSLALALFFGLQPALAAARLQPVQALRDD